MGHKLDNVVSLYVDGVAGGDLAATVEKYVADRFVQHSPGYTPGRQGLLDAFQPLVDRYSRRQVHPLRGFEDGNLVVLHTFQSYGYRDIERVGIDVFDTDGNDEIVAHWGVASALVAVSSRGHSQIDGPLHIEGHHDALANKRLVATYLADVLIAGDTRLATTYVAGTCIEHDPRAATAGHRPTAAPNATYLSVIRLASSGNFVAAISSAVIGRANHLVADLYRVDNGLIVEHWGATTPEADSPSR